MNHPFLSDRALLDIEEIWDHIAADNVGAADRLIQKIHDRCHQLMEFPQTGTLRNELSEGLRSIPVGAYIVFYAPAPMGMNVSRIVHGARDLSTLFDTQEDSN